MSNPTTPEELDAAREAFGAALKRCPFDGHAGPSLLLFENSKPGSRTSQVWKIKCWSCGALLIGSTAEDVVKAWNRRAP